MKKIGGEGFCRNLAYLGGEVRKLFTSFTTVLSHCYLCSIALVFAMLSLIR